MDNWTRESAGESWDVNDVTLVTVLAESIDDTGSVFHTEAWAALYINEPHWTQQRIFPKGRNKAVYYVNACELNVCEYLCIKPVLQVQTLFMYIYIYIYICDMAWQAKLKVITVQPWPAGPSLGISDLKYQCNILKIKAVLISMLLSHQSHVEMSKQCVLSKCFIYAMFLSHRLSLQIHYYKCTFSSRDIWKLFEQTKQTLKSTSCNHVRKRNVQKVYL